MQRVDIANIALNFLGEDPITSLEDDSVPAQTMKLHYALARDSTLEAYEWQFAQERFVPAVLAEAPLWGYGFAFAIPSNILRVTQVDLNWRQRAVLTDNRQRRNGVDHVVEGRTILCDRNEIFCRGTRKVENEGMFTNLFAEALAGKLAVLACYGITESNSKFRAMTAMYQVQINEAKSREAQQSSTRALIHGGFRRVR